MYSTRRCQRSNASIFRRRGLSLVGGLAALSVYTNPRKLVLDEIATIAISDSIPVVGGSIGANGEIVAWLRSPLGIAVSRNGALFRMDVPGLHSVVSADFVDDSTIEIVDSQSASIVRTSTTGRVILKTPMAVLGRIRGAVHTSKGWFVVSQPSTGALHVNQILHGDSVKVIARLPRPAERIDTVTVPIRVSEFGSGIIVTLTRAPFTSTAIEYGGSPILRFNPFRDDSVASVVGKTGQRFWVSSPLVALDSGYIQTLSHLSSDQRFFIRYDESGAIESRVVIQAALAVVAASPKLKEVIFARRVNSLQLVRYRWTWR